MVSFFGGEDFVAVPKIITDIFARFFEIKKFPFSRDFPFFAFSAKYLRLWAN